MSDVFLGIHVSYRVVGDGSSERLSCLILILFLKIRRPPRSTRTDTLFPYTTLFRSKPSCFSDYFRIIAHASKPCRTDPISPSARDWRSEEHTSELQSLMRISYAVFCLKKKINTPPRLPHSPMFHSACLQPHHLFVHITAITYLLY